jgi:hypothetical protein
LITLALFSLQAQAYFQMDLLNSKKATGNQASQWTLSDWLAQKSRMSLADTWLALHHQVNWFEFDPFAAHKRYTLKVTDVNGTATYDQDAQEYGANMYIGILNLAGEYEKTSSSIESYGGAVGLRLMGVSAQSTSLVGRYGFQHRQDLKTQEKWDNPYAEGELQLYIIKSFGLSGKYRYYFPDTSNLGTRRQGHSLQGGAFIDLGVLRLFANATEEPIEMSSQGSVTQDRREGYDAGVQFFF